MVEVISYWQLINLQVPTKICVRLIETQAPKIASLDQEYLVKEVNNSPDVLLSTWRIIASQLIFTCSELTIKH